MEIKNYSEFIDENLNNINDYTELSNELYSFYQFEDFDEDNEVFNKLLKFYNDNNEINLTEEKARENIEILINFFLKNNNGKFFNLIDGNPENLDLISAINFINENIFNNFDLNFEIDKDDFFIFSRPEEDIMNILVIPFNDKYVLTVSLDYIDIIKNGWNSDEKNYTTEIGFFEIEEKLSGDEIILSTTDVPIITQPEELTDFINKIKEYII